MEGVYTAYIMPTPLDPARFSAALIDLGVTPAALHVIRFAPPGQGPVLLAELKLAAKSRYRKLALLLHPDHNGGDAAKTERFSFLAQVIRQVESMEWRPMPQPPPPIPQPPQATVTRTVIFRAVPLSNTPPAPKPVPRSAVRRADQAEATTAQGLRVVFLRPT